MKTTKYLLGLLTLAAAMASCSPEEFDGIDEKGVLSIDAVSQNIDIQVNQADAAEPNQVTFTMKGVKEAYPVWKIQTGTNKDGSAKYEWSTNPTAHHIYTVAGDYKVYCYVGNRNGISDQYVEKSFHIDNSLVDLTPYVNKLAAAPWFIDNTAQGHMGCGPAGTLGTEWWSAAPNDKAEWGVYDNQLTFTAEKQYTFTPGLSGTMYVNNGCSIYPEYNTLTDASGAKIDFTVPVQEQVTSYDFSIEGEDIYLTFPAKTQFPYVANDAQWNAPKFRLVALTSKAMELVNDNGDIAWHYLLSTSHEVAFGGFDYKSDDNLWKKANATFLQQYYAHGGSWDQYEPYTHTEGDNTYSLSLPGASDLQWQAQYMLQTELNTTNVPVDALYDFSMVVKSNNDIKQMTIKLTSSDDQISLVLGNWDITGGEETVVYFTELPGQTIDGNYKMVFDFGGNPENTEITLKNICLIDHSKNKIAAPSQDPSDEPAVDPVNWDVAANLWTGDVEIETYNSHGNDWAACDPALSYEKQADGKWLVSLPSESNNQWQAQFKMYSKVSTSADKAYDFRVVLYPTKDIKQATVKWVLHGGGDNDNIFYTQDRHDLTAYEENVITLVNAPGIEMDKLDLVLDFGGNEAETEVSVYNIAVQEHQGPKVVDWTNADKNLWKKAELKNGGIYYAPNWAQIADFANEISNDEISVTLPSATFGEWQAQLPVVTTLDKNIISAEKKYNFRCKITSNNDHPGMTLKLVEDGPNSTPGSLGINYDANAIFYNPGIKLAAGEETIVELVDQPGVALQDNPLKLVIDFGNNSDNTEITIKDIVLMEAE